MTDLQQRESAADLVLGVDVGGTFTDFLLLDPATRKLSVAKVPTTPRDQAQGFMAGIAALGLPLSRTRTIVHGTTAATNAVLERKGARCGLITTAGFGDILELARRTRPQLFGLTGEFEALIPRERRIEVRERTDADGEILLPLDEDDVRAAVGRLKALGASKLAGSMPRSLVFAAAVRVSGSAMAAASGRKLGCMADSNQWKGHTSRQRADAKVAAVTQCRAAATVQPMEDA